MTRKRDRLEVIYDILDLIRHHHNSIRPTPLLRKSNLSSASFNDYFSELTAKQVVKEVIDDNGVKFITLTDKGFEYLERYRLIQGFINDFDL